jgi:hypothetical protein
MKKKQQHKHDREIRPRKRDRYFEIAAQHCPTDLRFITVLDTAGLQALGDRRLRLRGRSIPDAGIMMVHRPDTLLWLWRFLHECAHVKLHKNIPRTTPYHWIELDAERYVLTAIRDAEIEISKRLLVDSQNYLYGELLADLRAGLEPASGIFEYLDMTEQQGSELVSEMRALPRTTEFLRNAPNGVGSRGAFKPVKADA